LILNYRRTMTCPICKKAVEDPAEDAERFLPFCSDRCRLIDLGRWLTGKYQIPVDDADESRDADDDSDASAPRP